jgi:hypothetical protein
LPTNAQNVELARVPAVGKTSTETSTFETEVEYKVEVAEEKDEATSGETEPEGTAPTLSRIPCDSSKDLEGNQEEDEEAPSPLPSEKVAAATRRIVERLVAARAAASDKVSEVPPVLAIAQEPTAQSTPTPVEEKIKPGSRVRYLKASARFGMVGTVRSLTGDAAKIWLDDHPSLADHLRDLEATLSQLELVE